AAGSDQLLRDTCETEAAPALCATSTARRSRGVDIDRRGGDQSRRSVPDGLSSHSGVGARAQGPLVQACCRGERCLRPTDARDKDGPSVTVPSHDLESPTG
ncbi:unnamed protein product, partial [Sphacelaria rigidula]